MERSWMDPYNSYPKQRIMYDVHPLPSRLVRVGRNKLAEHMKKRTRTKCKSEININAQFYQVLAFFSWRISYVIKNSTSFSCIGSWQYGWMTIGKTNLIAEIYAATRCFDKLSTTKRRNFVPRQIDCATYNLEDCIVIALYILRI